MRINLIKAKDTAKFLFNRMRGVKYGGVKFGDGTFSLVKTSKLSKLNQRIDNNLGSDYILNLGKDNLDTVMRMVRPINKNAKVADSASITYLNAHGCCQLYDNITKKPVLDICERLANPIKTWWKLG